MTLHVVMHLSHTLEICIWYQACPWLVVPGLQYGGENGALDSFTTSLKF